MIDGIIAAQLRSAKRVVVPDLGSFIHKEGGQTVFMEFLKKDDGVLTAAIAREFGLDAAEAQAVAAEWALGVRRTVAGGKRYVIAGVGALHADANGLMVLEEEPGAAHAAPVFEPVIEPVITPVMAPAPVAPPVPEPVVAPVAPVVPPVPEPTLEPSWGSTIYKDTAPARQPELVWGAEPTTPRQTEPAPVAPAPAPAAPRQPEPAFGFEPAPAPAPAPRRDRADEQSKAFTLNDLYSDPEDEDVPDLSQPQFGERDYTAPSLNERDYNAPSFNDSAYNQTSFNDAAFNGAATLNDAVYGGAATLNDVYGAPEPPRQEHDRQEYFAPKPEYQAANHEYPAANHDYLAGKPERPADRFDGDSALRPPQLRRPSQIHSSHKRKPDFVVIIAIVAAVAAIGMIIYGLSNNDAVVRKPINAADTTSVQIDSASMEMPLSE